MKRFHLQTRDKGLQALLRVLGSQLRGKRLSRARRSIGSVLFLDFGPLIQIYAGKKPRKIGEWHIFIPMAPWTISKNGKLLLSSQEPPAKIDKLISQLLKGREVERMVTRRSGNLTIDFADGTMLSVKKYRSKNYDDNWTLFFKDSWSVTYSAEKGRYSINFQDAAN